MQQLCHKKIPQVGYFYKIFKNNEINGIVIKHNNVEISTQLAAISSSEWCISARFKITDAHGTLDKIKIAALNVLSKNGIKYTIKKQNNGKATIFKNDIK